MQSEPAALRCSRCSHRYGPGPDEPFRCDCGAPLELDEGSAPPPDCTRPVSGIWAFADALPSGPVIDLGAGGTPLVDAPAFDARFKLESCNPTGSFKDRGAAVTLSRAVAIGADRIKEDSSGNAGLAIAAHAARAGVDASIFVPISAAGSTIAAIRATGADVVSIEGSRDEVATACVEAEAGWYASHAWRPSFYAGTATLAWELVADHGGFPPDAVILPVGHGTLLLGLYRGFTRLVEAGAIEAVPRLFAAQLAGAGSLLPETADIDDDLAPGIRIPTPARLEQVSSAIEQSGGQIVPVEPAAVSETRDRLARYGFDVCTTSAVGVAARENLEHQQTLARGPEVTVVLTGRSRDR